MKTKSILLTLAGFAFASTAHAALVSYSLQWSGADFSNSATAYAFMTVDDTVFNGASATPPSMEPNTAEELGIQFFELTLNGTANSDGTYNLTSSTFYWTLTDTVDMNTEIVGQSGFQDFNVFSSVAYGLEPNLLVTNFSMGEFGPTGDETLVLTSFAPIPEPSAFALLGLGALGLVVRRRRCA